MSERKKERENVCVKKREEKEKERERERECVCVRASVCTCLYACVLKGEGQVSGKPILPATCLASANLGTQ